MEAPMTISSVLDEVLHLQYLLGQYVLLFKCRWFDSDNNKSHRTHVELDYKSINTLCFWLDEELVILAIKAHQVVYLEDLQNDDPQPTHTLRRRQHSQNLEFDRYIKKNGKILISIVLGGDKPISPHVIRFSNTIGVLTRDTFSIHYLKWADVPPEYIEVVKGGLQEQSRINKAARANQPYNYNSGLKSFLQ
ncbi:(R)-mandelonitrile lyase 1-like [Cucumis melo var. makuwa]|uniref:(R)-mandelonitrile lyase 1-like n=1 Tax=Cucumis melo var. makuwa TaxID=1194695 RepID=A0A5A7UHW2_CUCMM|nr:(R)-mandelonitrile lyase 1-like [Cucumis melo var. makuwa]